MELKLPCHFVLELLIIISGLCIVATHVITHFYNVKDMYQMIALLPDLLLIISIAIYIYTQVNFQPFYQFRCLVVQRNPL